MHSHFGVRDSRVESRKHHTSHFQISETDGSLIRNLFSNIGNSFEPGSFSPNNKEPEVNWFLVVQVRQNRRFFDSWYLFPGTPGAFCLGCGGVMTKIKYPPQNTTRGKSKRERFNDVKQQCVSKLESSGTLWNTLWSTHLPPSHYYTTNCQRTYSALELC